MSKDVVFVTGNPDKSKLFSKMVGIDIENESVDTEEIQNLDLSEIVKNKAIEAYKIIDKPVLVEDSKLSFTALGKLPGPFIKYFSSELGSEGMCRLLDNYEDRSAVAGAAIAYYDGKTLKIFEKELHGSIAFEPGGSMGFGWDDIFIPEGFDMVRGDMDEETYLESYKNTKPFQEVADFLKNIDKQQA